MKKVFNFLIAFYRENIERKIAIRFFNREMSLEYCGKMLPIAYEKLLMDMITKGSDKGVITYTYVYKGKYYSVVAELSFKEGDAQDVRDQLMINELISNTK
jgi:hypothetical protein